jgi:hypothetical protein
VSQFTLIARLVRYGAESLAFQLKQIPADKLEWQPNPASKSALQVVGEAAGVMRSQSFTLRHGQLELGEGFPTPANLEEALDQLAAAAQEFAELLESVEEGFLDRRLETRDGPLWGTFQVTFGLVDLLHHHGQITYIQSLLGDSEHYYDAASVSRYFGPPQ